MQKWQHVFGWAESHREVWLDCIRIYLGLGLFARGLLLVTNTPTSFLIDWLERARKSALDDEVNNILIIAEAKKRGVTVEKLSNDEVKAKTVEPTEADAQAFFNQNKAQIEQQAGSAVDFPQVKDQVIAYIRAQRQQERAAKFVEGLRAANDVKVLATDVTPPKSDADRARVLATVGGKNITAGDIEDEMLPLISKVQQQVYAWRKDDLDLKINNILLSQEAQKRGMTERALLESEVTSKVPVITEAQALDFYNKNKDKINGDFATVKYQLIEYLQSKQAGDIEGAIRAQHIGGRGPSLSGEDQKRSANSLRPGIRKRWPLMAL